MICLFHALTLQLHRTLNSFLNRPYEFSFFFSYYKRKTFPSESAEKKKTSHFHNLSTVYKVVLYFENEEMETQAKEYRQLLVSPQGLQKEPSPADTLIIALLKPILTSSPSYNKAVFS